MGDAPTTSRALSALVANLAALAPTHPVLASSAALGKAAKIDQKTAWRILNGKNEPTLDALSKIAAALNLEPWQLLVPGIDPEHSPVLQPISNAERDMYEKSKVI